MNTVSNVAEGIGSLDDLYKVLPGRDLEPLWTMKGALTPEPVTQMQACLWHYAEVRELIMRAGELISAEDADRRVLAFKNPGTSPHELPRTTDTLWAAIQLVMPGEIAPPHRHSAAALRYIVEGAGGFSIVDGRRVDMEVGDFVLTPNWSWHEHGNDGDAPVLWLDGLDLPMLHTLRLIFAQFQGYDGDRRPVAGDALRSGALRPRWAGAGDSPTVVWKLADVEAALAELRDEEGSPYDDLILEYRDPATNGPAMQTMSASMQLLRPGVETQAHRHTSSAVYHVARGSGTSIIGGERLEWTQGDTFALPTWAEHAHANPGAEDALLFSFSDEPAVAALGLLRERPSA
jgi:gentisate 1,2-dioxygenase